MCLFMISGMWIAQIRKHWSEIFILHTHASDGAFRPKVARASKQPEIFRFL